VMPVVRPMAGFDFGTTPTCERSGESNGWVVELFAEKALDEGLEFFSGLGKREGLRRVGPVELVAGGLGRDPDLADGRVGGDDELAGAIFKDDVHDAVIVFVLEGSVALLSGDERLLEGFEGTVGFAAEGCFVDHVVSVRDLGEARFRRNSHWLGVVTKKGRPVRGGQPSRKCKLCLLVGKMR